ncbi:MAG: 1-acyl-sn-glycerol-3-phosphate acyltransferase [Firmicutes bacterium]|nr:1-acyl-sn-glycerol-3-phosphate acyltransferase [Bacillota bacterium]MCL2256447.1 1-acyl-sn-glycerol-3-phosphate acyltransferase [Bacillota bacterium]
MKKRNKAKLSPSWMFWILRVILRPILWHKYRLSFDKKTSKGIKRNCFILMNHQASFDQFAMGLGFPFGINIVATDSIFRHGFLSWLMVKLTRPIPYSKGSGDPAAVKTMLGIIKDGGSVCLFPEGNRSMFGDGGRIVPGIGKLAKKFDVPVILCRLKGAYLTKPRWKIKPNRGKVTNEVVRIIQPEELQSLTADEVQEIIKKEIYQNDFEFNKVAKIKFKGKAKAENLESILFYCPKCKALDSLQSKKHDLFCKECAMHVIVNEEGFFEKAGASEEKDSFYMPESVPEWGKLQLEHLKTMNFSEYSDKYLFSDDNVVLTKVEKTRKQKGEMRGKIELFSNRFTVCGKDFFFKDIGSMSLVEVRKLNVFTNEGSYTVDCELKMNLAKYMFFAYHLKSLEKGEECNFYGY